ncbi:MAG: glycosyltransferase family 4 protein [Oxalobacteraceae bacterium]
MNILVVHNRYHYRGGEDTVVDAEVSLLRRHGHEVLLYTRDNRELSSMTTCDAAVGVLWSRQTEADIRRIHTSFGPELIHAHNTFPLISPSLYAIAHQLKIPVVQTLHNFRLLCPQAMLLRNGSSCEACVGHLPWRAVIHRCYRHSLSQSAITAGMILLHRLRGTWRTEVARYIVLNQLCRDKFVAGGLPFDRLRIKPNFVEVDQPPDWHQRSGGLFIGRLSAEKGLQALAEAVSQLGSVKIDVYGKGPLQKLVEATPGLRYQGFDESATLQARLRKAAYLVMPSTGVETFGLVAVEAFACGTPVIATRHGGLTEIVAQGHTGLLVPPGDARALARAIEYAETHPETMLAMGRAAREVYLERYTPETNYLQMMRIYREALASRAAPSGPSTLSDTALPYAPTRAGR